LSACFAQAVKHQAAGQLVAARALYNQILANEPNIAEIHCNLGAVLTNLGMMQEAQLAYRRAISLKPEFSAAYHNLSLVLKDLGQLNEACRFAEEAVRLSPNTASYYTNLAALRPFSVGDPYLAGLEALARNASSLPIADQAQLHLALAKAHENAGLFDSAFRQVLTGNALKRQQHTYDEALVLGGISRVRAVFNSQLMRAQEGFGEPSPIPVFVVGMPRSGTTLVEQILASHPQVFGAGELRLLDHVVASTSGSVPGLLAYPEMMSVISGAQIHDLGAHYVRELVRQAPKALRIIDKTPTNFFFAGLIHLALPNSVIIHTMREPIDNCVSCFFTQFDGPQPFDDLAELGRYYCSYETLMHHWRQILPVGRILEVHYEELVTDLNNVAKRLVAHCSLEWDERCLDFHQTKRLVRTPSATQVRRPIYTSSIGRWRRYEAFLGPLLAELRSADRQQLSLNVGP